MAARSQWKPRLTKIKSLSLSITRTILSASSAPTHKPLTQAAAKTSKNKNRSKPCPRTSLVLLQAIGSTLSRNSGSLENTGENSHLTAKTPSITQSSSLNISGKKSASKRLNPSQKQINNSMKRTKWSEMWSITACGSSQKKHSIVLIPFQPGTLLRKARLPPI